MICRYLFGGEEDEHFSEVRRGLLWNRQEK